MEWSGVGEDDACLLDLTSTIQLNATQFNSYLYLHLQLKRKSLMYFFLCLFHHYIKILSLRKHHTQTHPQHPSPPSPHQPTNPKPRTPSRPTIRPTTTTPPSIPPASSRIRAVTTESPPIHRRHVDGGGFAGRGPFEGEIVPVSLVGIVDSV